ncbi:MAG: aminotransferase class I/II-fold pyridoxal phosphate-dependent enzyme [bacterium]|nr:aminotransferase class I/II-fold pyridoxal phosphate-dependent enzyme [bacterium]
MAFPDGTADFRSDTVTRPTPEMRRAMAEAMVGDDVYRDDPTVNALEEEAASIVGQEAAVLTPTGTMGNQLGIMLQTRRGEDVLCDAGTHLRNVEAGAGAALSGVAFRTMDVDAGRITPADIDRSMQLAGSLFPRIGLMVWENTHNMSGGRVIPADVMAEGNRAARRHGLSIHLDGARVFNAAVASGLPPARFAEGVDTVQFCFSKGLGAPVGSILCGSADLVAEARYLRKRLGGAMRQAGIIAAPARIALRDWPRLSADHELASRMARGLADRHPGAVDPEITETNMVRVEVGKLSGGWAPVRARLKESGVVVRDPLAGTVRLVTHRDVDDADVERLLAAFSPD